MTETKYKTPNLKFKESGDYVKGTVLRNEEITTKFGLKHVLEIAVEDTNASTVLDGQEIEIGLGDSVAIFTTKALKTLSKSYRRGSRIKITLDSLKDTGKPMPYKSFIVEEA